MKLPIANNLCYEPTSVLDQQPSPSSPGGATKIITTPPPSDTANNTHHPPNNTVDLDNFEGCWDSILSELGLNNNDDSNTNNSKLLLSQIITPCDSHHLSQALPDFPNFDLSYNPNFGPVDLHQTASVNTSFGLDFIDDLIRAAQAFESNDSQQVQLILARLNELQTTPSGKPLQRAAFYFKEALQRLTNTPTTNNSSPPQAVQLTSYELVQTIRADKEFSGISPVSLFSAFTANQAILETVGDGSPFIHIIDFDIGFGGQWASFMRELVENKGSNQAKVSTSIVLRITAIVPEEFGTESNIVKDNLTQFARDLNLKFHIEYVLIPTFEVLSFKSVQFIQGETLVVHLSTGFFNRFSSNTKTGISQFLGDIRGISPSCVVVVEKEVGIDAGIVSFRESFLAGIEFYTVMMESIEVVSASGFTGGVDCLRRIETFVLRPRIIAAVEAAARVSAGRRTTWREAFVEAGMRVVGLSQFADFQADCLLRKAQVGGFHVAKRHGEMMLCWHDSPLVATSAWCC